MGGPIRPRGVPILRRAAPGGGGATPWGGSGGAAPGGKAGTVPDGREGATSCRGVEGGVPEDWVVSNMGSMLEGKGEKKKRMRGN